MKNLREADGDLIHHWYILALEVEVTKNKPIKKIVYETPYVLFRDENNEIVVLLDRCLHRGAQLSQGTVHEGTLQCPYHGWRYNKAGDLVDVPSEERSVKKHQWCAGRPPQKIIDGCVWIWPGDVPPVAEPSWRFPKWGHKNVVQYFMTTDFENEVTHLVQNFMDVPHTVFVHSKWFRSRASIKVPVQITVANSRVKVVYNQSNDSIGFTEKILNPKQEPMIHTDEFIFPHITRVDYQFGSRFFIINSQCSPISRYHTRVYTWIAYDIGWLGFLLKPFMKYYTRKVIQQDVEIMKNQGDNLKHFENTEFKTEPKPVEFKSTGGDEHHLIIDRMRSQGVLDRTSPETLNFIKEREFWI